MRRTILLAALLGSILALVCAEEPRYGGTLIIGLGTDIPIFDAVYCSGIPNLGIIHLVSQGLTVINPTGGEPKVLPGLAVSWEQSARVDSPFTARRQIP
jgi:ABC-type transport system substrate-binding protein